MKVSIQHSVHPKSRENFVLFILQKEKLKKSSLKKHQDKKNKETQTFKKFSSLKSFNKNFLLHLEQSFADKSITGKKGEVVLFRNAFPSSQSINLVYSGMGNTRHLSLEDFREAGGKVFQSLKSSKLSHFPLRVILEKEILVKLYPSDSISIGDVIEATLEGFQLSNYSFDSYKTEKAHPSKSPKNKPGDVFFIYHEETTSSSKSFKTSVSQPREKESLAKKGINKAQILSECVNFVRFLNDSPGNLMTPEVLSRETIKAAKKVSNLSITVWNKERIKKEKMGGLYGVSLGSQVDPRFIVMKYKGTSSSKKAICFVGKGLTFDTGGISLKPSRNMHEMKYDMSGGSTVIGAVLAIARLQLRVNVLGLIPSSENMPGPLANKPGDILIARNGKSVEVLNTDAEGRLILMDALSYASEQKPKVIFNIATLTGAMVVALGNIYTGVFTRDSSLWEKIQSSSQKSGERLWRMPLNDFHVLDMKGHHADLANISSSLGAGSSTAAAFLESFVKGVPWAHFDIAGTAWNVGNRISYCPKKGASGSIVRTFVSLAEDFQ